MKTLKLFYKINVMLLLSVLLTACPKDSWYSKKYIDQETKDYCLFGEGSYWIYQDSITLAIENVVIDKPIDREFQLYKGAPDGGHRGETFSTTISSDFHDSKLFFNLTLSRVDSDVDCLFIKDNDTPSHNGPEFKNSFYLNKQSWMAPLLLLEKKYDYTLNGITFNNIKIFRQSDLEEKQIYYWAKHIGLIRIEAYKNEDLISIKNLVEYNVKPYK